MLMTPFRTRHGRPVSGIRSSVEPPHVAPGAALPMPSGRFDFRWKIRMQGQWDRAGSRFLKHQPFDADLVPLNQGALQIMGLPFKGQEGGMLLGTVNVAVSGATGGDSASDGEFNGVDQVEIDDAVDITAGNTKE